MKASDYKIVPSLRPPVSLPFLVTQRIDPAIQYIYLDFKSTSTRLKVSRAIRLNKPIRLDQAIKTAAKREARERTYYERPPTAEIISDEMFLEKYQYYLDTPKIDYDPVYLSNRLGVLDSIEKLMGDIPVEEDTSSCGKTDAPFKRLTHQEIIRRYINSYTPYRGLLLFHGLGSGKTCSSISLIEGLMESKKIVIMTPASLQSNYRTQMKFCGEYLFRKKNRWKFEPFKEGDVAKKQSVRNLLQIGESAVLDKYIEEIRGVWMVEKGEPNFDELTAREKDEVDRQLTILIKEKYTYLNYNGITHNTWKTKYKKNGNPFDNTTVIIDEAHNFVSRIVNKLESKTPTISVEIYEELLSAENCRVVLLTGTPFINYPYELGALFNLIHGYTYILEVTIVPIKVTGSFFQDLFRTEGVIDLVEYDEANKRLRITKNPYGFLKQADGKVMYRKENSMYYSEFSDYILGILRQQKGFTVKEVRHLKSKHLPDTHEEFDKYFLTEKEVKNDAKLQLFQTRIVGMVSYLGDKTNLMPRIVASKTGKIHLERVEMSSHQVARYAEVRRAERTESTKKDEDSSSYRIFSRSACNFVFPEETPRPMPAGFRIMGSEIHSLAQLKQLDIFEAVLDDASEDDILNDVDGKFDSSDLDFIRKNKAGLLKYKMAIDDAMAKFETTPEDYFETGLPKLVKISHPDKVDRMEKYSPKFKRMLENILTQPDCHLIYSNFRKMEGIGLFRLALLYHGYKELKIVNQRIVIHSMFGPQDYLEKEDQRYFALFTGTETVEEKEIILNLYNNRFENLPKVTQDDVRKYFGHIDLKLGNMHGQLIKVLMITASGAEGIDLKNTRFVHIMEPYWHHVRINQVIGRARRICSHMDLPKDLQDVTVYMYLAVFGDDVMKTDKYSELKTIDQGETTDLSLYRIMETKEKLSERFLDVLKRTSIDCSINHRKKCFSFPKEHPPGSPTDVLTTLEYKDAAGVRVKVKKSKTLKEVSEE